MNNALRINVSSRGSGRNQQDLGLKNGTSVEGPFDSQGVKISLSMRNSQSLKEGDLKSVTQIPINAFEDFNPLKINKMNSKEKK